MAALAGVMAAGRGPNVGCGGKGDKASPYGGKGAVDVDIFCPYQRRGKGGTGRARQLEADRDRMVATLGAEAHRGGPVARRHEGAVWMACAVRGQSTSWEEELEAAINEEGQTVEERMALLQEGDPRRVTVGALVRGTVGEGQRRAVVLSCQERDLVEAARIIEEYCEPSPSARAATAAVGRGRAAQSEGTRSPRGTVEERLGREQASSQVIAQGRAREALRRRVEEGIEQMTGDSNIRRLQNIQRLLEDAMQRMEAEEEA